MAEAPTKVRASRAHPSIAAGIVVAWLASGGLAWFDVKETERTRRVRAEEALASLAEGVNALYLAEEARIDGELSRLRTELRAQGAWAEPGAFEIDAAETAPPGDRGAIDGRRLTSTLRKALTSVDAFSKLEVVVAGHEGLRILGVARDEEGRARRIDWAPDEREGVAKADWYASEVAQAIESAGRRVERGEITFEGVIERPVARAAVGVHDRGQLVQGALVASIDLTDLSARLATVVPPAQRMTLLSTEGRPLDPGARDEQSLARLGTLAARIFGEPDGTTIFEADGALVLGRPLVRAEGGIATTLALLETPAPPTGAAAWLEGFWPIVLGLFTAVAGIALVFLFRAPTAGTGPASEAARRARSTSETETASDAGLDLTPEVVALRDWLADIRGCLEREAATRGLAVGLRCEKSMPPEFESDPGWLGGLVVAMGREALDATADEKVLVEVLEEAGDTLRVEVDAGGVALRPIAGMHEVARNIGGRLEADRGRLSLVVPSVLI
ncbi:MAG: hypothetical protein AAGC67_06775 [Myxococcota bacterium]